VLSTPSNACLLSARDDSISIHPNPTIQVDVENFARQILGHAPDSIKILDLDGRIQSMNEGGRALLGVHDFASFKATPWIDLWEGADRESASAALEEARSGRTARFLGFRKTLLGEPTWWDVIVTPLPNDEGVTTWLLAFSRDISEHRRSETYFRLLAGLSATLSESLDIDATLGKLGNQITQAVADCCILDLLDDGVVTRVMWSHRDPKKHASMRSLAQIDPLRAPQHPVSRVLRSRTSIMVADVDEAFIASSTIDEEHAQLWRDIELISLITVPVATVKRLHGALSLGLGRGGRPYRFDNNDIALAEELGRRIAVTLDNAQQYHREVQVASALQQASLPQSLPQVSGFEFDSVYEPAGDEATIGGDWYDAFVLPDGRIALTVGDVTGHGLDAAVVMGRLRQAMRSAAVLDPDPAKMLRSADLTLKIENEHTIATAIAAVIDPQTRTMACALAGHPPPVLRSADGEVHEVPAASGLPLGLGDANEAIAEPFALKAGDFFAFYTDGILELDRDICVGELQVRECVARESVYAAKRPAKALFDAMRTGPQRDDIAILTLRVS
jgi:PAS domain S-box-containing protein